MQPQACSPEVTVFVVPVFGTVFGALCAVAAALVLLLLVRSSASACAHSH
jgi:hypothetical protein